MREQFAEEIQYKESEIALIDQVFRKFEGKCCPLHDRCKYKIGRRMNVFFKISDLYLWFCMTVFLLAFICAQDDDFS